MKYAFLFFPLFLYCAASNGQTFNGNAGSIPGTSTTRTCFSNTVAGVGTINSTYGLNQVCMNITHPNDDELEIVLTAPDGTTVPLTVQNGGSGNNYTSTCFSASASTSIKFGTAPFTGSYLPEGHLGAVNNNQNANGVWNLCIQDRRTGTNAGTLVSWSLTFNNSSAPAPPALPACAVTLPASSTCATATSVCDFSGLCGNTSGTTFQDWTGSGLNACFNLENNSFVKFVASATTASFSVWVPTTTTGGYSTAGIQMLFFSGTCNAGAVTTYGCYPHIYPYPSTSSPLITVVSAAGLTPGNTYYLMIDGFNGDKCTFTIEANIGVNVLSISPASPSICIGSAINLSATGGNGVYAWNPIGGLSASTGSVVNANPGVTTTYTVTSTTAGSCPITKDVTVTVNPLPVAPTASVTVQPSCGIASGTIVISAPTGATLEYSINGTTYQAGTSFNAVIPGTYPVTVRNSTTGCVSPSTSLTVNAAPSSPAAPSTSVTVQPSCSITTGTIAISAPTGATLEYSIDGVNYQAATSFNNLIPGTYPVTVRNTTTGCVSSSTSLIVTAAPTAPAAPTASVTVQPSCSITTGTIVISAPTGATLEYSIDGVNYQAATSFNNLIPGTYPVTVRNSITGCVSSSTSLIVTAAPTAPTAPSTSVTVQPSCSIATGTIVISAPTGATLEYSIDGVNYQAATSFNNLIPGTYLVTVRNAATGCVSSSTSLIVTAAPTTPAAPTASVTVQPSCSITTGTIVISAPTGATLEYSINGTTYQAGTSFNAVNPGTYPVTVRNSATGCVSPSTSLIVTAVPASPIAPSASVTVQPSCSITSGTIAISAPTGATLEYSINGATYQAATSFTALIPGTYNVTVRNSVTGCVSSATSLIVTAAPSAPVAPSASVTVQPSCIVASGIIFISAPTGANLEYSINGINYQTAPIFTNVAPGTYPVTARNLTTSCVSSATSVTVNTAPLAPVAPSASVTVQPSCTIPTGTITFSAPVGANLEYSINGINYQASTIFTGIAPGGYMILVRNTSNSCITSNIGVIINPVDLSLCGNDIYFPSAFTPNGDGLNDLFGPAPLSNLSGISEYRLLVYNRYGAVIFSSTDPVKKWDGRYKGNLSGNTNFVWKAEYKKSNGTLTLKKGSVTIIK